MPVHKAELEKPFPKNALKQRQGGGGKALTYVETHTVIHRLNDATENCWDFKLTRLDLVGDLYVAIGELTIPGLGTRTGIGVQRVVERAGEDLVKGAASDCLKKCATLFGVGLELYGPDYEAVPTPINQGVQQAEQPSHVQHPPVDATTARMRRLHAVAKDRGLSHDELHAIAKGRGKDSLKALNPTEMDTFTNWLEKVTPPNLQAAIDAGREGVATAK